MQIILLILIVIASLNTSSAGRASKKFCEDENIHLWQRDAELRDEHDDTLEFRGESDEI